MSFMPKLTLYAYYEKQGMFSLMVLLAACQGGPCSSHLRTLAHVRQYASLQRQGHKYNTPGTRVGPGFRDRTLAVKSSDAKI